MTETNNPRQRRLKPPFDEIKGDFDGLRLALARQHTLMAAPKTPYRPRVDPDQATPPTTWREPMEAPSKGDRMRDDLKILQDARVLFAHQSVGWNLINGLKQLSKDAGVAIDFAQVTPDTEPRSRAFAHVVVGQNGAPATKQTMFAWVLRGFANDPFDIALLKFCYVDIGAQTDVARVFASHHDLIAGLRAKYPQTVFVPVTVPLRSGGGVKDTVNRWLGRRTQEADNAKRSEYNALLRAAYASEPVFDLAGVESTHQDGRRSTFTCGSRTCEQMAPEYTDDGGHLNEMGSRVAATALVHVLVRARRSQLAGAGSPGPSRSGAPTGVRAPVMAGD